MSRRIARFPDWTGPAVFLYGTLSAVFVAFVMYHAQSLVASTIDLNGFGLISRELALGKGFSLGYGPTIRRAPLYPFIGAALLKLFGHYAPGVSDAVAYRPILLAQCLVFGLTCLTAWAVARRLFGPRVALVAALLCPLVPQSLRYIGMTEVETLMGFFLVLLAYTGLNLLERPGPATGAWFGLGAAAATLTKPVTAFYPVLFLLLAWWHWRGRRVQPLAGAHAFLTRARVAGSCAALLCFALPLLPWTIRNLAVTNGQFMGISSNGPGEFLRGYVNAQPKYYLLRQNFGGPNTGMQTWDPEANAYEARLLAQHGVPFYRVNDDYAGHTTVTPPLPKGMTTALIEAQKDRIEGAEMKRLILHQPAGFVRKFVVQLATFWYIVETRTKSLLTSAIALVVLALAAVGMRRARRQGAATWPLVAIVVYLNIVYAANLAFARYSMPLYPTLLVLSAGGLASLAPRLFPFAARSRPVPAPAQAHGTPRPGA
jgi:4-amino-4-deoxy-L-arabinose transferase-like glycosyltransferase